VDKSLVSSMLDRMSLVELMTDLSSHDERGVSWTRSRSFRARVISPQRFELHQGSRWGCGMAGLMIAVALMWLGLKHEVELGAVEGRQRVKVVERGLVFGMAWKTVDYDEVTVMKVVGSTKSSYSLELKGPGWSRQLKGAWLTEMDLQRVEQEASSFFVGEGKEQVLRFPAPRWVSWVLMLVAVALVVAMRPARTCVDGVRREIEVRDWAGLRRESIPAARVVRVSVEDGDPAGRWARLHLPERWLIVAHLQPGGERILASVADRETAVQWAARVSLMFDQGRLAGVSAGEFRLWDREGSL
jgi:hypothetical protein